MNRVEQLVVKMAEAAAGEDYTIEEYEAAAALLAIKAVQAPELGKRSVWEPVTKAICDRFRDKMVEAV